MNSIFIYLLIILIVLVICFYFNFFRTTENFTYKNMQLENHFNLDVEGEEKYIIFDDYKHILFKNDFLFKKGTEYSGVGSQSSSV